MKRYAIFALLLLFVATGCKKSDHDIVEKFVREVKADDGNLMFTPPTFQVEHIGALLAHAGDGQLVAKYPRPSYSSYYGGPIEAGLVMLYAIEAALQQKEWPFSGVGVIDLDDLDRKVPLSEVLPVYQAWWSANAGKGAAELRRLAPPLKGTGLAWVGTPNMD